MGFSLVNRWTHVIEHVNSNEIGGFTFGKIIIKKSPNLPKLNTPKLPVIQCFKIINIFICD